MKRSIFFAVALLFALYLAAVALADTKPAPAKPSGKGDAARDAESVGKKPKTHQITGIVEEVDVSAGTLTVKGRRKTVSLKAGEKVKLDGISLGDKVLAMYSGDTASSVKMIRTAKGTGREASGKEDGPESAEPGRKDLEPSSGTPAER